MLRKRQKIETEKTKINEKKKKIKIEAYMKMLENKENIES